MIAPKKRLPKNTVFSARSRMFRPVIFPRMFTDGDIIADWAKDSLARMVSAGIISGSNGKLNPTGKVTRAEVAKMLWALENQ